MEKMVKCKACGAEIAKSAKICPHCGKKQGKKSWKIIGGILIAIGLVWAINDGMAGADNSGSNKTYNIGETITTNGLEITVKKVQKANSISTQWATDTPSTGAIFVIVEYKYKNIGKEALNIFNSPSVSLHDTDSTEYTKDTTATLAYESVMDYLDKIGDSINPGITVNDAAVFEIAKEKLNTDGWIFSIADEDVKVKI